MKHCLSQDRVIVTKFPKAATAAIPSEAAASTRSPSDDAHCLMLIDDCWKHIFDFLSMRDVFSLAQASKRQINRAKFPSIFQSIRDRNRQ